MNRIIVIFIMGLILNSCSPSVPDTYVKAVPPRVSESLEDPDAVWFDPKVDILFVVDNSGSMADHQNNLISNVSLFTASFFTNNILKYHIGAISTDTYYSKNGDKGALHGNPRFIDTSTPDPMMALKNNLNFGTSGYGSEKMFDPVYMALTTHRHGYNKDFYRDEAYLVLIFLSDANDQSTLIDDKGMYKFLMQLKRNNKHLVMSYGAIIPSSEPETNLCPRDSYGETPISTESFLALIDSSKKNILNLCSSDFGSRLADIGKEIARRVGGTIYLTKLPQKDSIRVLYGTQEIPSHPKSGWMYDSNRNLIILGDEIVWDESQPPDTKVKVLFDKIIP